jgi:hypothetical protein
VSSVSSPRYLYLFLDEAGNFDFTPNGTKYFMLSAICSVRPFDWDAALMALKYDELERGSTAEYFHAASDKQIVRNRVFAIIEQHLDSMRIDTVIVEKRKAVPELQPEEKLYPRMLGYLLRYVITQTDMNLYEGVIVLTDAVPVHAKRKAIEKGAVEALAAMLPASISYQIMHHDSKSCIGLQVADYCNWAIYRKWDRGDERSYRTIQRAIHSEFDIFKRGRSYYY